jgi:S1-C subfamily serine protease
MNGPSVERLVSDLCKGNLPDSQPWDLASAIQYMADNVIVQPSLPVDDIECAVRVLVKHRFYDHARRLAETWYSTHGFHEQICKHQIQATINLSSLDAASKLLDNYEPLLAQKARISLDAQAQIAEYEGLRARIAKQEFVASNSNDKLRKSVERYLAIFRRNPDQYFWQGINAVALRAREEREGISNTEESSKSLASKVYAIVIGRYAEDSSDPWLCATASEAALAMKDCDGAELWLYRFLLHPHIKPFDIESYSRQLREIWRGNPVNPTGSCADKLSSIIAHQMSKLEQRFLISANDVHQVKESIANIVDLEKNFLNESTFTYRSLQRLLDACSSVGCVSTITGERLGTGFLISRSSLDGSEDTTPVFVTNAHVICDVTTGAIPSKDARISFEVEAARLGAVKSYKIGTVLFTSPPGALGVCSGHDSPLDVTVVSLDPVPRDVPVLPVARSLPLPGGKTNVYVVGHPRGAGLQISLHDSRLLDIDDDEHLIHYRTPTDPGSSGSPVFNSSWEVVALHHGGSTTAPKFRGGGNYEANEGISLHAIRRKWKAGK